MAPKMKSKHGVLERFASTLSQLSTKADSKSRKATAQAAEALRHTNELLNYLSEMALNHEERMRELEDGAVVSRRRRPTKRVNPGARV